MVPYATEVCSLTVLESRSLKSKCWKGWFLPKAPRENSLYPLSLPLGAAGNHWNSLARSCPPISACVHMAFSSLSVCLKSPSPLIRTLVIDLGPTPSPRWCYANIFNLIIPVKILYSNHVISTDTKGWEFRYILFSSVQFSHSVVSDSLRLHEPQHTRPPCPPPTPTLYPNSCPLSRWCHLTISSSIVPFSSCPLSFPASGSFPMNQLFASGGQSIGVSASTSVLPMNTQDWSPLGWTGWISLQAKGLSRVFSNTTVQKHQFFSTQLSFIVQLSHPYMTTGKTIALTRWTFVDRAMSLLLNILSRLVIAFLPRRKRLLISWLHSSSAVILEPPKIKSLTVSTVSPSICHEVMGPDAMILVFWMLSFKPKTSGSPLSLSSRGSLGLHFLP